MSARKTHQTAPRPVSTAARPRKKPRGPRVRLTHFEVRRGGTLRLRIAIADDALAEVGDELGALLRRIAPSTRTTATILDPVPDEPGWLPEPDFVVSRAHSEHDAGYHAQLREHLVALFTSLCDTALEDALDVGRHEHARRAEGGN